MRFAALCLLALTCATPGHNPASPTESRDSSARADFDIRIVNGQLIDGSGSPRVRGDVGIRGDSIAAIGDLSKKTSRITIDATGQVVTPGFIDLLGNSEGAALIDPLVEGKVRQGVTTEVTGEGHSPGPINDAMAAEINRTRPPGAPEATWRSLADFMRTLEGKHSAINFAFYVGAANPREIVLGDANRAPTPEELKRMEEIADQAMHDGAVGVASALIYPPGRYATTEELAALARVAGRYGGSYWTHMRSESANIMAALDEAFRVGREAHVPVNIFHLKVGGSMRGHMADVVARIEEAQKSGLDVASNVYPYTATSTDMTSIVPAAFLQGGYLKFVERLKDPTTRAEIASKLSVGDGSTILVRNLPNAAPEMKQFERKRLNVIAEALHVSPAEAALRCFEASTSSPIAIYFGLNESDLQYALKQPWVAAGSDSGAVVGAARQQGAHPRAYGTFPRILGHYVRDEKLFTLEEAVRKVTSLPASRVPFHDRGLLRTGMKADVVVFDPNTIRDVSTYEDPHHYSEGISNVIVNGVSVLRGGAMTGALPGKVLRGAGAMAASRK